MNKLEVTDLNWILIYPSRITSKWLEWYINKYIWPGCRLTFVMTDKIIRDNSNNIRIPIVIYIFNHDWKYKIENLESWSINLNHNELLLDVKELDYVIKRIEKFKDESIEWHEIEGSQF